MQPELEFDKPWKTGFLLDHVECTKDLKWMSHDAQLIIQTQGSEYYSDLEAIVCVLRWMSDNIKTFREVKITKALKIDL